MAEQELIPLVEAAKRLGVSRMTMHRLVKEGHFTIYASRLDRRKRLIDAAELAKAALPVLESEVKRAV